jgi:hypothetical protein
MDRAPAHGRLLQNAFAEREETAGIVASKGGKREAPGAVALGGSCQLVGLVDLLRIKRLRDRDTPRTLFSFARAELTGSDENDRAYPHAAKQVMARAES